MTAALNEMHGHPNQQVRLGVSLWRHGGVGRGTALSSQPAEAGLAGIPINPSHGGSNEYERAQFGSDDHLPDLNRRRRLRNHPPLGGAADLIGRRSNASGRSNGKHTYELTSEGRALLSSGPSRWKAGTSFERWRPEPIRGRGPLGGSLTTQPPTPAVVMRVGTHSPSFGPPSLFGPKARLSPFGRAHFPAGCCRIPVARRPGFLPVSRRGAHPASNRPTAGWLQSSVPAVPAAKSRRCERRLGVV